MRRRYLKQPTAANVRKMIVSRKSSKPVRIPNTKSIAVSDAVSHMKNEFKFRSAIKISMPRQFIPDNKVRTGNPNTI